MSFEPFRPIRNLENNKINNDIFPKNNIDTLKSFFEILTSKPLFSLKMVLYIQM